MGRIIGFDGARRRPTLALVACALLFRLLVPAGWMPEANARGITLNWCSEIGGANAHAEAAAMLADALGDAPTKEKPAPDQPCGFAAAAQALTLSEATRLIPPAPAHPLPPAARLLPFPGRGLSAPPPPATGPPLLA